MLRLPTAESHEMRVKGTIQAQFQAQFTSTNTLGGIQNVQPLTQVTQASSLSVPMKYIPPGLERAAIQSSQAK